MIQLSEASFLDLARRFKTAEAFARWLVDNKVSLRAERLARKAAREGGAGGLVESGLRVPVGLDRVPVPGKPVSAEGLAHPRVKLAVARKAAPMLGLGKNAGEVFAALLEFCNADTLRCDPGIDAIADRLGRVGKYRDRHIRRGIEKLVGAGFLRVASNAGVGHANAYFPQWDRLAEVAAALETGVRLEPDSLAGSVRQTQKKIHPSVEVKTVQRARTAEPDRRQRQLPLVAVVPRRPAEAEAVPHGVPRKQAELRVMQALNRHLAQFGPRFAERTRADITPDLFEAAVSAEVRAKGTGFDVILEGLGPGPPAAGAATG